MQGTTYILENYVHILKCFIQLKYYTVNCLQRACGCVRVCARLFSKFKQSQLRKRTESSGMHGNANDNLLSAGYHRRWLELLPLSHTRWVHLEMPTMIIVACSWVSSIRNSVGNWPLQTRDFLASLAFPSMIDHNQGFPTILNVATTINFWLGNSHFLQHSSLNFSSLPFCFSIPPQNIKNKKIIFLELNEYLRQICRVQSVKHSTMFKHRHPSANIIEFDIQQQLLQ